MFGFAGVGASPRAHAEAPIANVSQESVDLAKLYDAVVETIARRFVDEDTLRRVDWRALTTSARASVIDAPSLEAAVERINALLAELKTSHTALYTPNDYQYYILLDIVGAGQNSGEFLARKFWGVGPWYPGIGAFTTKVGAAHFIDGVMEGSPAQSAGLKFGDEIVSVDGRAYSPIASFSGRVGETVALEIRRDSLAPAQIVSVPVIPIRPTAAFSASTRASARVIERNGLRIGYVHLWSINEFAQL